MQVDGVKVSVIIRCRNEDRWIGYSIQSALDHIVDPEIIVVDNESVDESMDVVKMFEKWHDIKTITISDYSPGRSLNMGIQAAKYPYILVLSAHCCLTKIDLHKHQLDLYSGYSAVFGKQIPYYKGRKISRRYVWSHFGEEKVEGMWSDIENRPFLHNALCMYDREFVLKHPFDEELYGKEDRYWAIEQERRGYKAMYDPSLECDHHWTPNGATWKGIA